MEWQTGTGSKFDIGHETAALMTPDLAWMGETGSNDPVYAGCGVRGMFISCWAGQGVDHSRCAQSGAVYNRVATSILAAMALPLLGALA